MLIATLFAGQHTSSVTGTWTLLSMLANQVRQACADVSTSEAAYFEVTVPILASANEPWQQGVMSRYTSVCCVCITLPILCSHCTHSCFSQFVIKTC